MHHPYRKVEVCSTTRLQELRNKDSIITNLAWRIKKRGICEHHLIHNKSSCHS
jgi:hypothetical protein